MAKVLRYVRLFVFSAIGVALIRMGEIDDSPGLGGVGLIIIGIALYLHWRGRRAHPKA